MRARVRVLIVDDHELVREGLRALLACDPTLDVVGEASTGMHALELIAAARPDVVLMDLIMPVMDGAEATARIRDEHPQVRVVVLSGVGDGALVEAALRAGAVGYLAKDSNHRAIVRAIHDAAGARDRAAGVMMPATRDRPPSDLGADLTRRERQVLALLAEGLTNAQIAERLSRTNGQVRLDVGRLLAKLQAPNRTAAAVIAVERRLV